MRQNAVAAGVILLAILVVVLPAAGAGQGAMAVDPHGIVVYDPSVPCPHTGPSYTSINAAVAASPANSKIQICPGTYNEQVVITKPVTLQGVSSGNADQPLIQPTAAAVNATEGGNFPAAAVIFAQNASNVNIDDLTIDGGASGGALNGCGTDIVGVYFQNASGKLEDSVVRNTELDQSLFGCQDGLGVFVESSGSGQSKVEIDGDTIHDYQKNGITADGAGVNVSIHDDTVTGVGSTDQIAQNGVQISDGAVGEIQKSSVIDNLYGRCTDVNDCGGAATNVLAFAAGQVSIHDNDLGDSQVNVYVDENGTKVDNNRIYASHVFDGIDLVGDGNEAQNNVINDSDEDGVYVSGSTNHVGGNSINEALNGIEEAGGGNNKYDGNRFSNVESMFTPASIRPHAAVAGGGGPVPVSPRTFQ